MDSTPVISVIESFIEQILRTEPVPGIGLALTDRSETLHAGAYGLAEVASATPLTPGHLMQIGSIGKSFTTLALLQLHEAGRLDLHAPVKSYLPWLEIPSAFAPATIHHLLTHTAGIPMGTDESPAPEGEAWSLRRVEAACAPGTHFHYSNTGFKVLGLVLEAITGRRYADVIREAILAPLGMRATEPTITYDNIPRHAVGYAPFPPDRPLVRPFTDARRLAPAPWFESATADGCITSTPGDLAIYVRALLNRFAPLISGETYALMTTPHVQIVEEPDVRYGYGLEIHLQGDVLRIGHGGGMVGFTSYILAEPETGLGVAVMLNGIGPSLPVADFSLSAWRAGQQGGPLPDLPPVRGRRDVADAAAYAGRYRSTARSVTVVERAGGLEVQETGAALIQRSGDVFHIDHPDWNRYFLHFSRNEAGQVAEFLHGSEWFVGERYSGPESFEVPERWRSYVGYFASHNPWFPGFRICLQKDRLVLIDSAFATIPLVELHPGFFRVGGDANSPERLRFDAFINSRPTAAEYSGTAYYRMFTE